MTILRTVLASLVIIVAATATAASNDMWPPPAQYDSGPLLNARFPEAIISYLSPEELFDACRGKHLACSHVRVGAPCQIFLPLVGWERMVRHEMGHCRGWPGDHQSYDRLLKS